MYKFVKEFKKPANRTNSNASNQSQSLSNSNYNNELTSRFINSDVAQIFAADAPTNDVRRIPVRSNSENLESNNRKAHSANDLTQRQPFLKIKSNHSFNQRSGLFDEKGRKKKI